MANRFMHLSGRQDKKYGPYPRCIYSTPDEASHIGVLTDEHAYPEALGGRIVLEDASCPACKSLIDPFEARCLNQMFHAVRTHVGIRTAKSRRRTRLHPVIVTVNGAERTLRLPIDQYPTMMFLPAFNPPGFFLDEAPKTDFAPYKVWVAQLGEDFKHRIENLIRETGASHVAVPSQVRPRDFARLLAKMAHCYATAIYGLDSFRPWLLDAIRDNDETAPLPYLIGGNLPSVDLPLARPGLPRQGELPVGYQFTVGAVLQSEINQTLIACSMRLFAWANSPEYLAVVGEATPELVQRLANQADQEST